MDNNVTNNKMTKELSNSFESTEDIVNKNKEIETQITTISLIEYYLDFIKNQDELISSKDAIQEDFDKINKIVTEVNEAVKNTMIVVEKQKDENKYKDTIDKMYDSFETLKTFGNNLVSKLNDVVIQEKPNSDSYDNNVFKEEEKNTGMEIIIYGVLILLLTGTIYGIYSFFN